MTDQIQESNAGSDRSDEHPDVVAALSLDTLRQFIPLPNVSRRRIGLAVTLAMIAWLSTAIYKVQPDEQGVILRFGKWVDTTQPGLHFHWPYPIETALLPKVTQV